MEYVYAVMLLNKAGKEASEQNITKVLEAAGVKVDAAKVKSLTAALDGVDVQKVIEENSQVGVAVATSGSSAGATPAAEEKKKEEKKKEEPSADAGAGLGALFG